MGGLESEHNGFELHIAGDVGEAQQQVNCSAEDESTEEDCESNAGVTTEAQHFTESGLANSVPIQVPALLAVAGGWL